MFSNMQQALATAKKAISFDNEGRTLEALKSYEEAANSLKQSISLNEARNQEIHNELQRQLTIYSNKIGELRNIVQQKDNVNTRVNEYQFLKLVKRLESDIIHVEPSVNFDSVAGLEDEKEFLNQAIVLPIMYPHLFNDDVKPYSGFLLFGELEKATAGEAKGTTFCSLSASGLVSKYQGESEMLIRSLFASARKRKPSIIFIDEIDSLATSRSDSDSDGSRRIKTELFIQMQGNKGDNYGGFVLAASNTPQDLDGAFMRRFDKLLYIPLPSFEARKQMINMRFTKTAGLSEKFVYDIANKTDGFSESDIDILSKKAKMQSLARLSKSCYFKTKIAGVEYFTPCESNSRGAIKMKHTDVPEGRLQYALIATTDDIIKSVRKAIPRVYQSMLRQLEQFADENAEKISNPVPIVTNPPKKSKTSTFLSIIFNILD